jgi:hypothetical protein
MTEKIIGYVLLAFGIVIITLAALNLYLVFSRQAEPLQVFSLPGITVQPSQLVPQLENAPPGLTKPPPLELFPALTLNTILNKLAHMLFMGFIVSVGYRIASLGTMLVRPIIVHLKETPSSKPVQPDAPFHL